MITESEKSTQERISDAVYHASMANEMLKVNVSSYETSGLTTDGAEIQVLVEALTTQVKKHLDLLIDLTECEVQS